MCKKYPKNHYLATIVSTVIDVKLLSEKYHWPEKSTILSHKQVVRAVLP
jgi:hypothetical protein